MLMLREEVYRLAARRHELYGRLPPGQSASLRTYHEQEFARLYRALDLVWNFDYYIVDAVCQTAVFLVFALELEPGIFISFAGRGAYPEVALFRAAFVRRILVEVDVVGVEFTTTIRCTLIAIAAYSLLFEIDAVVVSEYDRIAVA